MLKNTFCHIPGIGEASEKKLWTAGLDSWDACSALDEIRLSEKKKESVKKYINESERKLQEGNAKFFAHLLPPNSHWRLFPEFRNAIAYLDIETTGLETWDNTITTIALYDGKSISYYVQGENLEEFERDIDKYQAIVTYNGKCFDVPFIEW